MRTVVNGLLKEYYKYNFHTVDTGMLVQVPVAELDDDSICRKIYDLDVAVEFDIFSATEAEKENAFVAAVALEAGPWR
tara:strand:+ start:2152 stop:2385 length:234 start_codon:yes stop_codon:yes gene_type:complete